MPYKDRKTLPLHESTMKVLLKRKHLASAKQAKSLSWDEFLLEATK